MGDGAFSKINTEEQSASSGERLVIGSKSYADLQYLSPHGTGEISELRDIRFKTIPRARLIIVRSAQVKHFAASRFVPEVVHTLISIFGHRMVMLQIPRPSWPGVK